MEFLFPFRNPTLLFLLLIPALMLVWIWIGHRRGLVLPFDHRRSKGGGWISGMIGMAESIPVTLLGVVIMILAGPQRWAEPQTSKVMTNIEFCVDVSGSMTAQFGSGNRYDAAMVAINDFLDYRSGDAFGLTFFGESVLHWVPLTTDVSAFRCAPPFMAPGKLPRWFNGTHIGKALLACRKVLSSREEGDRMIILVSDGYSADLYDGRDKEIARTLIADGIRVYAVHIAESSLPDSIVNITALTGGEVFTPGDRDALKRVFQRIDEMQETRLEKISAEAVDDYGPYARAALWLLLGSVLALFGLRYTPW
ncbi:MAG: Ca-activated chloride channel family protein [Candidatus Paceibacteria bacterium]|jgi:Ca-activated chloride channel family protein